MQAHDLAVWQQLRTNLGIPQDGIKVTDTRPMAPGIAGAHPVSTVAQPPVAQTPTGPAAPAAAKPGSTTDVLAEVKEFYKGLMKQPGGVPPGVVADFKPDPMPAVAGQSDSELPSDSENTCVILDLALRYQGVPYRWGGANRGGIDCSGLIIRAAADGGKPGLPHSAAELWKIGTPIPKGEMKAGDLVFFKNTYKPGISHVGIYSGGGKFLHASSGKKKVTIGSLSDPYFVRHWAGAKRWDSLTKKQPAAKKTKRK